MADDGPVPKTEGSVPPRGEDPDGDEISHRHAKWVEVSVPALQANLKAVRSLLAPGCGLIAVVKANGYGHGIEIASRAFEEAGADLLAVTTLDEAIRVRRAGARCPVLLLAPALPGDVPDLLAHDLTATVVDTDTALLLSRAARERGRTLRVHLKVDTGMGRAGCLWTEAALVAEVLHNDPGLEAEGIYTHFATAIEPDGELYRHQRDTFAFVLDAAAAAGHRPRMAHAANSAACLNDPESRLDAVRVGTILYGQKPPGVRGEAPPLRETWRFCCRVLQVKELPAGWTVGYRAEHRCDRPTRIAVLAVGYADGLAVEPASVFRGKRGLRRWVAEALGKTKPPAAILHGKPAPFLGRIAAQMSCVDVTAIPEARPGDVAHLPARRVLTSPDVLRVPVDG